MSTSRIETLRKFLEEDPTDPFSHYAIALEYASTNDTQAAIDALEHMLPRFPSYVPAYQQLGILLHQSGKAERARTILEQGIAVAGRAGDHHAQSEMRELLDELDDDI